MAPAEGRRYARLADQDYSLAYSAAWLARIAFERGRWTEATELAEAPGPDARRCRPA